MLFRDIRSNILFFRNKKNLTSETSGEGSSRGQASNGQTGGGGTRGRASDGQEGEGDAGGSVKEAHH